MRSHANRGLRPQAGGALVIMVLILVLAGTATLFSSLNSERIKIERDKKTATALAEAKATLIGWSVGHASMPGALPCPDVNNSGISGTCTATNGVIGRLPWRTLGLSALRDGYGECLWYGLSPLYRNTITVTNRVSNPINSSVAGTITVRGSNGVVFPAPVNPVIAVIIAPGPALTVQSRANVGTAVCGGNVTASNYLDTSLGVNNSTGNVSGSNYQFIAGITSNSFNDRLVFITSEDLYGSLRKRIADELVGVGKPPITGLRKYYADNSVLPWAGDVNGNVDDSVETGPLAYNLLTLTPTSLRSWIINNGWMSKVTYQVGENFNPDSLDSFPQNCAATTCIDVRGLKVPASLTVAGGASTWTSSVCEVNSVMTSCPLQ